MKVTGIDESMAGFTNLEKAKVQGGGVFKDMFTGLVQERLGNLTEDLEKMNAKKQEISQLKAQQEFTEVIRCCRMAAFW